MTSPWSSTIKAAELVGTPTSKDEVVEQDKVKTTIRYWEFNFKVPLDHNNSKDTRELSLHAKLVYDHHPSGSKPDPETRHWKEAVGKNPDLLLYLCGGPGDANGLKNPALKKAALDRGYQILFVDFRGTGQSGAITKAPDEGAEYLAMFRQDNIVRDLEAIRLCLADELPEPNLKFSLLGQSFGGWIILTYLSFLPSSLKEVGIHAGLPPLDEAADVVYKATFQRVIEENDKYYERYEKDVERVRFIVTELERKPQTFTLKEPEESGESEDSEEIEHTVTGRTFLTAGRTLGAVDGATQIHELVKCMHADLKKPEPELSNATCELYLKHQGFKLHERPLYGVMHESIYCYGPDANESGWAAERVALKEYVDKFWWVDEKIDVRKKLESDPEKLPVYFSGEMIYPFLLRYSGAALSGFETVANELAEKDNWPQLYDLNQLSENTVKGQAIAYSTDMYVAKSLSDETAKKVNGLTMVGSKITKGWSHKTIKGADMAADVFKALFPPPPEEEELDS